MQGPIDNISLILGKLEYIKEHVDTVENRVGVLEEKIDRTQGEFEMIKTFLMSPQKPYLSNVSTPIRSKIRDGSIFGLIAGVVWFLLTEILPKILNII